MPAAVAIPLITAAASTGASIVGAKLSSNASKNAAKTQTDAANRSGELQAQSAREALAFQREQSAQDQQRFETTQRSNYDQWAARQGYQSSMGQMLGLPGRNIPAYQSSMPGGSPQGMPNAGASDPKVAAFVADWQKTHPISEGIAPLADALKKAGLTTGRFDYGGGNLSNNEVTVGGKPYKVLGGEGTPGAYWYTPGTDDSAQGRAPMGGGYVAPMSAILPQQMLPRPPLTPALQMPRGY